MKHLQLFEHFKGGSFESIEKSSGNPECLIYSGRIDNDTHITYGIYISGTFEGNEFMEIYVGSNYNTNSNAKSWSRFYAADQIPPKWKSAWSILKQYAIKENPVLFNQKLKGFNTKTGVFD